MGVGSGQTHPQLRPRGNKSIIKTFSQLAALKSGGQGDLHSMITLLKTQNNRIY